ncbi:MAG: ABC transporter ATP-binding protein [Acetobacteraceae bacterium]
MPDPILEARDLSVAFGGVRALDSVSFAVTAGAVFGIIGPNGAGKTTLLNAISGVCRPRSGQLHFDGRNITGQPPYRLARLGIARTFQIVRPFARMTVRENVEVGAMFGTTRRGSAGSAAAEALVRTGLDAKADFMPPQLTLAERKRLEVARAIAMRPRVLLLDEVFAGLNHSEVAHAIELVRKIRGDGLTVIIIEHVMKAVLALCDRLLVLNFGTKLAEGPVADVIADPAVVQAYLGSRFAKIQASAAAPA